MSSFTDDLEVRKILHPVAKKFLWIKYYRIKQHWVTIRSFRYYVGAENSTEWIEVPEGFETDFASVPRGLWNIFPPDGIYSQATVLHDYLYTHKIYNRKKCDDIFLEAMEVLGVGKIKRGLMYRAVRLFGRGSYNK